MGLTRKLVPGFLAAVIVLRPPQEALRADEVVHSRAPEPPHNHPELHEPAYTPPNEAGILDGSPQDAPVVPVGWEEAANVAVRARYEYQRTRTYLVQSFCSPMLGGLVN
jgi:hypothetical protein